MSKVRKAERVDADAKVGAPRRAAEGRRVQIFRCNANIIGRRSCEMESKEEQRWNHPSFADESAS